MDLFNITGKTALVTGGRSGIGKAIAKALYEYGATVVIMSRNYSGLNTTAQELDPSGERVVPLEGDVGNKQEVTGKIDAMVEQFGAIDILVNNAGVVHREEAIQYPEEKWRELLSVHLDGTFWCCQAAGRHMLRQQAGKIINIASLTSFIGGLYIPAYAAAKGGVAQITKSLSNEWAQAGVNVNAIAPGYIKTDFTEALLSDTERYNSLSSRIPAGRWGEPEDLMGAAVFLASRASEYVHGTILVVDGGWMGY